MAYDQRFDRAGPGLIHLALAALWLLPLACNQDEPGARDAAEVPGPIDAGQGVASLGDAGLEPAEPETGVVQQGGQWVAQAIGRAPKGVDVDLSRQRAAARARANLLNLLKLRGLQADPGDAGQTLRGVTIERYWTRGKLLYALARTTISGAQVGLNQTQPAPSKSTEETQPDAAAPTGGTEP